MYSMALSNRANESFELHFSKELGATLGSVKEYINTFNSVNLPGTGYNVFFNTIIENSNEIIANVRVSTTNERYNIDLEYERDVANFSSVRQVENLIVSIIGSGVSEYTAITSLLNWLSANVSYDYSYSESSYEMWGYFKW